MKNLKPYNQSPKDVYDEAVKRLTDKEGQKALRGNEIFIHDRYALYDGLFKSNYLDSLSKIPWDNTKPLYKRLLSLYDYNNRAVSDIREGINALQTATVKSKCQYCGIDSVTTMDHIVPKGDYPEYAIHAYNLIPCCSACNTKKGEKDFRQVLNLYLDTLPQEQFLFLDISVEGADLVIKYRLENKGNIDATLYAKLESHFEELHLLERMREAANNYVAEFVNKCVVSDREAFTDTIKRTLSINKECYGYNHWKIIMEEELVKSEVFWNYIDAQRTE